MDSLLKTLGLRGSELKPLQLIKKILSIGCKSTSGSNATSTTAGTSQTAEKGQLIGTPASSSETLPHEEDIRSDKVSSEDELAMIPLTDDTESPIITVRSLLVGFLVYLVQRKECLPLGRGTRTSSKRKAFLPMDEVHVPRPAEGNPSAGLYTACQEGFLPAV
ncbi:hypothetical protein PGTUg99_036971 [Puccinia graminis f. sp. tritici]|uniref:Uncharacterized protein n=1 Tax=Puccinia graminis f. sp. tritici TaxID=56615 RepID=A0A5B0PPK1_PUCGR|nr:hypothetical protein PGTUg99_036971 [Puccinia graminis f. sp. tritici]